MQSGRAVRENRIQALKIRTTISMPGPVLVLSSRESRDLILRVGDRRPSRISDQHLATPCLSYYVEKDRDNMQYCGNMNEEIWCADSAKARPYP